jgi:RimJ/RimL family protein N-acetyltransferase
MHTIETERLLIRNFQVDDWQALQEMIVWYEASEYAAYDQQWPTSEGEIKGITEWFAGGDNFCAVCLKETNQFIGFVALTPEEGTDCREYNLGYVFHSPYHSRGYAAEACRAVLRRAFGELRAVRVIAATAAPNRNSCRLLERLGFRRTAEQISSFKETEDGKPIEFLGYTYALSKEEWENRSSAPDRPAMDPGRTDTETQHKKSNANHVIGV